MAGGRWSAQWGFRYDWRAALALLALAPLVAGCGLRSLPFTGGAADGKTVTVPATIRHGADGATLVIVDVTINGKGPYPFALDTGASLTLLDQPLARQLGLPVTGPQQDITGVGGAERVTPVAVTSWAVGGATLPARTITSAPIAGIHRSAGVEGLLGSDVLSSFSAVTIDYAASAVILTS